MPGLPSYDYPDFIYLLTGGGAEYNYMTFIFGTRNQSETSWPPRRALHILLGPRLVLRSTLRPRMSRIRDRLDVAIYAKVAMGYHDPHWTQTSWGSLRLAATDSNVHHVSHPYGSQCPCFLENATAEVFDAAESVSTNCLVRCTRVRSCVTRGDELMISRKPLQPVLSYFDSFLHGAAGVSGYKCGTTTGQCHCQRPWCFS